MKLVVILLGVTSIAYAAERHHNLARISMTLMPGRDTTHHSHSGLESQLANTLQTNSEPALSALGSLTASQKEKAKAREIEKPHGAELDDLEVGMARATTEEKKARRLSAAYRLVLEDRMREHPQEPEFNVDAMAKTALVIIHGENDKRHYALPTVREDIKNCLNCPENSSGKAAIDTLHKATVVMSSRSQAATKIEFTEEQKKEIQELVDASEAKHNAAQQIHKYIIAAIGAGGTVAGALIGFAATYLSKKNC